MKIIVLHGDDSSKINTDTKNLLKSPGIAGMSIERLTKDSNIIDSLSAQNLFSQKALYVLK
jgi:hypothetical protein